MLKFENAPVQHEMPVASPPLTWTRRYLQMLLVLVLVLELELKTGGVLQWMASLLTGRLAELHVFAGEAADELTGYDNQLANC